MKSIDLLMEEHRALEAMLDALEITTERLRNHEEVAPSAMEEIFQFCKRFTDGCHHVHEEQILFPALAEHGLTPDMTPIAALAAQHESGRAFLRGLQEAYARFEAGEDCARHDVHVLAREYITMLREHIAIEDHYFRSPAAMALTPVEDERLTTAILSCRQAGGPHERERFLEMAARARKTAQAC